MPAPIASSPIAPADGTERRRGFFSDEDRQIAAQSLGEQHSEFDRRHEVAVAEAEAVEKDRRIVALVAAKRQAARQPWDADIEARMLADRAKRRRTSE